MPRRRKRGEKPKPDPRTKLANSLRNVVRNNDELNALELIKKGADVNYTFDDGKTLLLSALSHQSRIVSVLIDAGADVNATDDADKTALMYCAEYVPKRSKIHKNNRAIKRSFDYQKLVSKLIQNREDVNKTDENGKTALIYALQNNNEIVAGELIKAGADLKARDNQGMTALMYAAQTCGEKVVAELLRAGCDHSVIDNDGKSALFFAGNESVVQRLIKAGADLNITDNQGRTALMCAIEDNKESIAFSLLDAGADHSVIDEDGKSSLFFAAVRGKKGVIQRLIKAGADLNVTDNQGKTVLICAVLHGRNKISVAAELIEAGVDVDATDNNGKTALICCAQYNEKSLKFKSFSDFDDEESDVEDTITKKLIEAGADVNITDDHGKTALMYAVENTNEQLACALIDAGGNVNIIDKQGKSALSYSVQTENVSITCKLIKAGAVVNLIGAEGKTPLMFAAQCNSESLVNALIEAGADIDVTDDKGRTALIHSLQSHHENLALVLIKAGANVNISDHEGNTALFYGLANEKVVRSLIEDGHATVNRKDNYGRSVLFYSFTKSLTVTNYLIEKGGDLNLKDNCSMNIISFFIEHLMNKGDMYLFNYSMRKLHPLHKISYPHIIEAIVNSVFCKIFHCMEQGSNMESLNQALVLANYQYIAGQSVKEKTKIIEEVSKGIKGGNLSKVIDLLVKLGANPDYADADGNTALHYATCLPLFGKYDATVAMTWCQKLKNLGVSFDAKNHKNETPLLFSLSKKGWINTSKESSKVKTLIEICKYLLVCGSSVEETTRNGKTVFHLILELFQEGLHLNDGKIAEEVLDETMGLLKLFPSSMPLTEINKRHASLNSPLHLWAMLEFHSSSVIRKKSDSSIEHDTFKKNLLGTIFEHLVACGAKLNHRNKNEETPIHLCRSWTAVKLLKDAGADPKALDSEGCSPLLVASKKISIGGNDHLYQDVSQEPKAFWKTALDYNLDPWTADSHGASVLSILIQEEAIDLSKALVEVACEQNYIQIDKIAISLLNAVCQDSFAQKQWKSILVKMILKSRKDKPISFKSNENTALHLCCRNIVKPPEEAICDRGKMPLSSYDEESSFNVAKTSVHWPIAKQLLSYGMDCDALDASGQSCLDIAKKCPTLRNFLLKPSEVLLAFPWTSISTKYKSILSKVARRQECNLVESYRYHKNYIQKGSFGLVFAGMNEKDGREVAIKRIEKLRNQKSEADKKEIKTLTALADCEQVVRYLSFTEDEHFSYMILELMEGNLDDYLDGAAVDDTKSVQLCGDVLNGLKFLHQQNILHRDIKPSNILFKTYPKLCLKIADFGLSRLDTLGTSTTSSGSVVGTRCWIAPELLKFSSKKAKHQKTCDVFSAGLVIHYILSGKKHPFTPADCTNKSELQINNETEANVMYDRMEGFKDALSPEATDLIHSMLDSDQAKRPEAALALKHPFFWSEKKKMDFLSAVGNQPEFECPRAKRKPPLGKVEDDLDVRLKSKIMPHRTWSDARHVNMPTIYREMTKTKRRKYKTSSVVELVRFIRNTLAHISEDKRPTLVRKLVLEDFVFLENFSNLVMEVFKCIMMHGWDSREEIKYQLS